MTAATGRKGTIVPLSISSAGLWVVSLLALLSVMGCDALGSGPSAEETDAAQKELETAQLELDTALKQISSLKTQVSEANAKAKSAETAAASGRISLEQAELNVRIYAQNNLGVYSLQFQEVQLVWEVASSREGEDFYYIQLNYRPFGGFDGAPGVEEFITDKSGDIKFRQVLLEPDPEKKAPEQKKEQTQGT